MRYGRASPQGEAGGDSGYQATAELQRYRSVKGMSMTLFADGVRFWHERTEIPPIRGIGWAAGWGIGAVYNLDRSLYARLDYARIKVNLIAVTGE